MAASVQIIKVKIRQYQWRAILPNLMLIKVTRYMVDQYNYYYNYSKHDMLELAPGYSCILCKCCT